MSGHSEQDEKHEINVFSMKAALGIFILKPALCQATMNIELLVPWQAACEI